MSRLSYRDDEASMKEVYISTDIEADGPIPGVNSMLSLGAAAFSEDGEELGTFSINLQQTEGAVQDPSTMEWWSTQPAAWAACRVDPVDPYTAMRRYCGWVESLPGKPVFVAYPAGYDFTFVYWYLMRYVGRSPFRFTALDIKSYAAAVLGVQYHEVGKRLLQRHWPVSAPHTHVAVDDAVEQGKIFIAMMKEAKELRGALVPCRHEWHSATAQANLLSNSFKCPVCADTEHPGWVPRRESPSSTSRRR